MTAPVTRADRAVLEGLEFVAIVRDLGQETIENWLRRRDRLTIETMAVALAAMVPDDRSAAELLAWCEPARLEAERRKRVDAQRRAERALQPVKECGTHAAFNRHKSIGETPCAACVVGERTFQRERARRRRAA